MMQLINGTPQLEELKRKVKLQGAKLAAYGGTAHMVVVLVGEDPIVRAQAHAKVKLGSELGVSVDVQELPTHTSVNSLFKIIRRLNGDEDIDGIYLESPLPHHLMVAKPLEEIEPEKDVSGYHPANLGRILAGDESSELFPLFPKACLELLAGEDWSNRRVVLIGGHLQLCRPLGLMLANRGAVVTLCDKSTPNLTELCRQAEVLVTAVGQPGFIRPGMAHPDLVVVDAGNISGPSSDVDPELLQGSIRSLISLPKSLEGVALVQLFANLVVTAEKRRD